MKTITQNLQNLKSSLEDKPQINIVVVTKTRSPEELQEAIAAGAISIAPAAIASWISSGDLVLVTTTILICGLFSKLLFSFCRFCVIVFISFFLRHNSGD